MSGWTARRDDHERARSLRLIVLRGRERKLAHERDLMRRDLAYEMHQHCRVGPKTSEAIELEQKIQSNMAEWLDLINELRALQSQRAVA